MTQQRNGGGQWQEPTEGQRAGLGRWKRPLAPYDRFMEEQGIPIYRDIGLRRIQDLPLKPWKHMGGNGTFIQLFGTEGMWGMYVVEIPPASALNVERHLYEEVFLVAEGRGSTEVWQEGSDRKNTFEWTKGTLFTVPLNAWHRLVNASNSPALLLVGTTAPPVMNLFMNPSFVFNTPYNFTDRYDATDDFFRPNDEVEPDPFRGLAMKRTATLPDIIGCELPLDNRRSPGYRRIEPYMAGNKFYLWIGEHEVGRYAKAHAHQSAAVLICLKGKGYTYTWPRELGTHPWETGLADKVRRQDYEEFGMVSAAPMSGDWFHAHFGTAASGLRLTAWFGPHGPGREAGRPGEDAADYGALELQEGGTAIPYWAEDPYLRKEFEETLAAEGARSRMPDSAYQPPAGVDPAFAKAGFERR